MPPHILFHALSDDPARQFGCMASLFHNMLHHHPRFFRKRSSSSSSSASRAAACGHSHFQPTCINKPAANSAKARPIHHDQCGSKKHDRHMETAHVKAPAKKRSSEIRERSPEVTHKGTTTTCDFSVDYTLVAPYSYKVSSKKYYKRESPSILDSSKATNYTIREPPSQSFDGAHSPDQCCSSTTTPGADSSRSLPGSPRVGFSKTRDGRSQFAANSLFDKPRVSLDYDRQGQDVAASRDRCHISHIKEEPTYNEACKEPLEQLKESLRALAKLQQTTQQFVDAFAAPKDADKAAKKMTASSSTWWNARKARSSNNRHASQTSMEGPPLEARASSFDYNEAIRISQKIENTPARLSLDGRELVPKVVLKLREAMRLGIVNRDQAKCSSTDDQKKGIDRTSLRSALLASKEEFGIVEGISSNTPKSVADRGGQRSNVIARLMGLHDLPVRPMSTAPHPEYCCSAKHKSYCTIGALRSANGAAGAPKFIKREALVHEDRRAQALQKDLLLIGEMQLPIAPRASSHYPLINYNGPASKIPRHSKMEVMPSHLLYNRAGDRSGRARAAVLDCAEDSHHSEKISAIILQERLKHKQEHVEGLRDVEFELGRRQVKTSSSLHNTVELSTELKGLLHPQIQENLGDCVQTGEISDEKLSHFHQSKNMSKRYDQNILKQTQCHVSQLESKPSKVVLQPRYCRMKTLSMETHFSFDVPRAKNEENGQISLSTSINDRPKLQVPATADAGSSASSSPSRKRDTSHKIRSDKRKHDKKASGTKHQLQLITSGVKLVGAGDQTSELATKPASPTATRMMTRDTDKKASLRKHRPAEAAPIKVSSAAMSDDHMRLIINRVAAGEEYSASAKSGAAGSKRWKMKRNGDKLGLGGRTVSAAAAQHAAQQLMNMTSTAQDSRRAHVDLQTQYAAAESDALRTSLPDTTALQSPYYDKDNAESEVVFLDGQFEYVEAILERAGLLGDKEDDMERQRRLGAWVMSDCAPLTTFLEIERSCRTVPGSRHQRRLIFDCVYHILAVKSAGGGCSNRGLLLAVCKELKRQMAATDHETGLHLSTSSNQRRVRLLILEDMDEEACWTCSCPSLSTYIALEDAIFQDLIQELTS